MMNAQQENIELIRVLLAEYREEYQEACDIWKILETKAQVALTVAGVFLAAALGFAGRVELSGSARWILVIVVLALGVTFVRAMMVLKVEEYESPHDAEFLARSFEKLLANDGLGQGDRLQELLQEVSARWRPSLKSIEAANIRKRSRLFDAHYALAVAALATTWAALVQVIPV